MLKRNTVLISIGILMLSGMFLLGQESWAPCIDTDKDGYGTSGSGAGACPFEGWDCDDSDPGINPGAAEILDDGIDQNCDGNDATDEAKAMLLAFMTDDDQLMVDFLTVEPTPGPGTDVTVNGILAGSCRWQISDPPLFPPTNPTVTYTYTGYNRTGLIMDGVRDGQMSLIGMWTLDGILEFTGTYTGWIYYQLPMNAGIGPILEGRTWYVCNYNDSCPSGTPASMDNLYLATFFTNADMQ